MKESPTHNKDELYAYQMSEIDSFSFSKQVVNVFPDMIQRSIPGYSDIITGIGKLAHRYAKPNTYVYDLGCSLGAVTLSIAKSTSDRTLNIIGIDNSKDMVNVCRRNVNAYAFCKNVSIIESDIVDSKLQPCSFVVMNFTLQFISLETRLLILKRIYQSLAPGGALVISEKISNDDSSIQECLIDLHHEFKRENGYSELEISQKRTALENVMVLDSTESHISRLRQAGFETADIWFQHFNFASILAIKADG